MPAWFWPVWFLNITFPLKSAIMFGACGRRQNTVYLSWLDKICNAVYCRSGRRCRIGDEYAPREQRKASASKNSVLSFFFIFYSNSYFGRSCGALLILNKQFKNQALTNIRQAQETVITELKSDIDIMSMRLSHLIYTNNNEILAYAAEVDTADFSRRYEYEQKLEQAGNLALEPVKDIISVGFYMKDGRKTYIKNDIRRTVDEVREMDWYRKALEKSNTVCLGSYDTISSNDLFVGGKKDLLILVFALAPDVTTDRSQKIEMVVFY